MNVNARNKKLLRMLNHFHRIQDILGTMDNEEREHIMKSHTGSTTIQHCARWGRQACEELLDNRDIE